MMPHVGLAPTDRPHPMKFVIRNILRAVSSRRYRVEGDSMLPTLADKHYVLLVSRRWTDWEPQRGDIVVFRRPGPPHDLYVKRVVGMPGEDIQMVAGQVYLDGGLLKENYPTIPPVPGRRDRGEWWTGPDEFVLLGDNRRGSEDSRIFGPVRRELIVGRVWFRYWPLGAWSRLHKIK